MKLKVFLCSLVFGCLLGSSVFAENIPKEKLAELPEYSESIVQQLEKHDVKQLINDDYFLRVLSKELKNKNSTAEEKVYFFYQMLQKIQWAFCGGIGVPLPDNYAHNSLFQCITFKKYREYLSKRNIDDKQFFDLVFTNMEEKPILAAYSFLLGSLVTKDINKSLDFCKEASIYEKPSWFRSMFIHNMMLMSQSLINIPHEDNPYSIFYSVCYQLLSDYNCKEEEKEDLVIAQFFEPNIDSFGSIITHHLIDEKDSANDCFVLSCFILVQNRLNEENFKYFVNMIYDEIKDSEEDVWKKDLIERCIITHDYNVDYYDGMDTKQGVYNKSWDNISMAVYDDGILYYDDDYAAFQLTYRNKN